MPRPCSRRKDGVSPNIAKSCHVASSNFPTYHMTFMWPSGRTGMGRRRRDTLSEDPAFPHLQGYYLPKNFCSLSATSRKSPTLEYPLTVSSLSASSSGRPITSRIRLLGGPDRLLPVGEVHPGPALRRRQQLLVRHDLVHQPQPVRLLRGNFPPRQRQVEGGADPGDGDEADDSPRLPGAAPASPRRPRISPFPRRCGCRTREPARSRPDRETVDGRDDWSRRSGAVPW